MYPIAQGKKESRTPFTCHVDTGVLDTALLDSGHSLQVHLSWIRLRNPRYPNPELELISHQVSAKFPISRNLICVVLHYLTQT